MSTIQNPLMRQSDILLPQGRGLLQDAIDGLYGLIAEGRVTLDGVVSQRNLLSPLFGVAAGRLVRAEGGGSFAGLSPTKGNLAVGTGTTWGERAVGADDLILMADAAEADGVKWTKPPFRLLSSSTTPAGSDITYTVPGGTVTETGGALLVFAAGEITGGVATLGLDFGGSDLLSADPADVDEHLALALIVRTGASSQAVWVAQLENGGVPNSNYRTLALDWSVNQDVRMDFVDVAAGTGGALLLNVYELRGVL